MIDRHPIAGKLQLAGFASPTIDGHRFAEREYMTTLMRASSDGLERRA